MRIRFKQMLVLLMVLVFLLSLCGCAQALQMVMQPDESKVSSDQIPEKQSGESDVSSEQPQSEKSGRPPEQTQSENADTQHNSLVSDTQPAQPTANEFSEEAENSLYWLRDRMDFPQTMFGAAFLGYTEKTSEANPAMLEKYPFIAEINADHTVRGTNAYLYCLVPLDENATVSVNLVQWPPESDSEENLEVLYRSESGEPVLFFADCGDDAYAYDSYIQVQIVDNAGNSCVWYPQLDAMGHIVPCLSESGDYLSFDFTEYGWLYAPSELLPWLSDGYSGVYATVLDGCWTATTMAWNTDPDRFANYYIWFFPEDETSGRVEVYWEYLDADPSDTMWEEVWSGFFTSTSVMDGVSYMSIDLSLVGGKNLDVTEGPYYMSETYPFVISPEGYELIFGIGEYGISLPFMQENNTLPVSLTLVE